jgi:hypothetical protein
MSLGISQRSPSRQVSRACLETLEDRKLFSFTPAVNYATIGTPSAIVTADLNNDGKLDLVTCAKAETGSISVFIGNGAGGFGAAQRTVFGTYLSSMAVADINNDGKTDLVVSDGYYGFDFLAGKGDGTFQLPVYTASGEVAAVGRFNGDSYTDVLVSRLGPDWEIQFQVYSGNGQGGFTEVEPDLWYYGSGMTAVDLNNDGKLDVVTAEGYVFPGNGDGTFQFDWEQPALLDGGQIATGDFTGDGKVDAIVAGNNKVSVLRGRGDGTFDAPITQPVAGNSHTGVATADFNGDGRLDAVLSTYDTGTVRLMLGNGDGTLRDGGAFATGSEPSGVVVGDFNRDGRPDVAVSNAASRTVSVLINDGVWGPLPPPSLRVSDAAVTEGNTGSLNATFTVSLSQAADVDVTVQYSTANITAAAGSDYTAKSGSVTIPAGQTSRSFTVAVLGDRLAEPTETFAVNLSAATNATIGDSQGIGTIQDNEPRISINNVSKYEGRASTTAFTFTVTLSAAYDQAVTVNYATANGTATAGTDYTSKSGSVTFAPGETIKTITVVIRGDKQKEANETFFVNLFGPSSNAPIGVGQGIGTILDDDNRR